MSREWLTCDCGEHFADDAKLEIHRNTTGHRKAVRITVTVPPVAGPADAPRDTYVQLVETPLLDLVDDFAAYVRSSRGEGLGDESIECGLFHHFGTLLVDAYMAHVPTPDLTEAQYEQLARVRGVPDFPPAASDAERQEFARDLVRDGLTEDEAADVARVPRPADTVRPLAERVRDFANMRMQGELLFPPQLRSLFNDAAYELEFLQQQLRRDHQSGESRYHRMLEALGEAAATCRLGFDGALDKLIARASVEAQEDAARLDWLEMSIRNAEVVEFSAMPYGASGEDVEEIEMIVAHDGPTRHCEIRAKLRTILDAARGVPTRSGRGAPNE